MWRSSLFVGRPNIVPGINMSFKANWTLIDANQSTQNLSLCLPVFPDRIACVIPSGRSTLHVHVVHTRYHSRLSGSHQISQPFMDPHQIPQLVNRDHRSGSRITSLDRDHRSGSRIASLDRGLQVGTLSLFLPCLSTDRVINLV